MAIDADPGHDRLADVEAARRALASTGDMCRCASSSRLGGERSDFGAECVEKLGDLVVYPRRFSVANHQPEERLDVPEHGSSSPLSLGSRLKCQCTEFGNLVRE